MVTAVLAGLAAAQAADEGPSVEVEGLVEAYYAYDLARPANGVIALRGFDARHATPTLSIAALALGVAHPVLRGRVALQAGDTPASYTAVEPTAPGGAGVAPHGPARITPIREAWVGARAPVLDGLSLDGGVFLSPVGFDALVARDNKFWSLSNLGFGLPFYFTGARASLAVDDDTTLTGGVFTGWNSVVDGDRHPSFGLWWNQGLGDTSLQVLWFGGDEGTGGFRATFDAWILVPVGPLEVLVHADAGFEPRARGVHTWEAGQVALIVHPVDAVDIGVRGDVFREAGPGVAIFWPTRVIGEATLSAGWRPVDGLLTRLELRHDRAGDPVFYGSDPDVTTETSQTTLTLGVSGSFAAVAPLRRSR